MSMTPRTARRAGLTALLIVGLLALTRPWTIEPIETAPTMAFDATSYVSSAWPRVLGEAQQVAVDAAAVLPGSSSGATSPVSPPVRKALFVTGTGVVTDVNLQSRVGLALVRLDGVDHATVALQVGPVLRGTALRDALSFVRFTDFANQFDFAGVANALNDRVLATVLGSLDARGLAGQLVTFTGAAAVGDGRAGAIPEIVPVTLTVPARGGR